MFDIRQDNLTSEQTLALLAIHLAGMHANSLPNQVSALDTSGLQALGVTVWTAWQNDRGAGIDARFAEYERSDFNQFLHLDFATCSAPRGRA